MKLKNPPLKYPETLIFDFGNVLLDIDIPKAQKAIERLGVPPIESCEIHPNNTGIFLEIELGTASASHFVAQMRQRAQNPNLDHQKIIDAWNEVLLPYDWSRFELIRQLKKNHRVVLLSNTNEPHHSCFEQRFDQQNPWGIRFVELFDRIFYSDQMGLRKPNREIYQRVQEELGASPESLWFVDDNAPNLVQPAALGWNTHHLKVGESISELFVACLES